jgi:hypothetical protein
MTRHNKMRGIPICIALTKEAHAAVREMARGPHKVGDFMSTLILVEVARREERDRLQAERESAAVGD